MSITSQTSRIFTAGTDYSNYTVITSLPDAKRVIIPAVGAGTLRVKANSVPSSNDDGEPVIGNGPPGVITELGGITALYLWVDTASAGATLTGVVQVERRK